MSHKVLVIIDIQNDITKHYRNIIGRLNAAIDWAVEQEMDVVYIEGDTVFDLVREGVSVEPYLPQVREMAEQAKAHGLNIDYFPTNFVVRDGLIWYVDYECNSYMDEWSFDNWGVKYWSRTPEFEKHLRKHEKIGAQ